MERGPKTSVFGFKNKSTLPTAKQSKRKRNHFKLNANINKNYCVPSATDHFRHQTREGAAVMRALRERAYAIHKFALFHLVPRIK